MFGQGFNYGFLGKPLCFTDTTDIFKDNSGVALYTLDYDGTAAPILPGTIVEGAPLKIHLNTTNSSSYNGSGSTWTDLTSSNYDATLVSSPSYNSSNGGYLDFDGSADYGTFSSTAASDLQNDTYGSIEVWVYGDTWSGGNSRKTIFGTGHSSSASSWSALRITPTNGIQWSNWNGSTDRGFRTGVAPPTGEWLHIVVTTTASGVGKIYLNGVSQTLIYGNGSAGDGSVRWFSHVSSNTLQVGALDRGSYGNNYDPFNGRIAQVRYYTSTLTDAEVLQNYSATKYNYVNYDATPTNVDFGVGGKSLYGARFNGSSSRIDISNVLSGFTNVYSFSIWAKIDNTNNFSFFSSTTSTAQSTYNNLIRFGWHQNGNYYFSFGDIYGARLTGTTPSAWTDGNWHNFVFVSTPTQKLAYVDGSLFDSASSTKAVSGLSNVTLGHYGTNYADGSIDQVRIFSKALSSAEVGKLYGNGAGEIACTYTSTTDNVAYPIANTAYYKLDNNSKDSARSTGKFNEGAIFNGSSSRIITGLDLTSFNSASLSVWIYWEGGDFNPIFGGNNTVGGTTTINRFATAIANSGGRLDYVSERGDFFRSSNMSLFNTNAWNHIVITDDFTSSSTASKVYVNGTQDANFARVATSYGGAANTNLYIGQGRTNNNGQAYLTGLIDQVRIYNTVLDSTDVSNLYAETVSDTSTLSFPSGKTAIATYQLDGNSTDLSGNYNGTDTNITYAYDGTESNIEYRFGRFGQAAVFNGSSRIVTGITSFTNNFTISMWLNPSSLHSNGNWVFGNWNSTTQDFYIYVKSNGQLDLNFDGNDGSGTSFGSAGDISIGNWNHFAVSMSNGVFTIYLNSVLLGGGTTTNTTFSNGQDFEIGNMPKSSTVPGWNGSIDQVRIYSTALTSSQVTELYNEKPEVDISNFKAVLYDGTGATDYISSVGFDPNLIWFKERNGTNSHQIYDGVRGYDYALFSNLTDAQYNYSTHPNGDLAPASVEANGFFTPTVNNNGINRNGGDYVAWNWKGGGLLNRSASFNGSNSYITVPTLSGFTNYNFTMSFWFNSTSTAAQYFMDFRNPIYMEFGYDVGSGAYNNTYSFIIYTGTQYAIHSSANLRDGNWHHIAVTYDGVTLKMYIDNATPITSTPNDNTHYSHSAGNKIGASATGTAVMNGSIDQVRIFNRAISSSEVTTLYNETASTINTLQVLGDTSCVATYPLGVGAGDLSNTYSGTPSNVTFNNPGHLTRNNSGTIESMVSANTDAGFSIATYTGVGYPNASTDEVGHGLSQAPDIVFIKGTGGTGQSGGAGYWVMGTGVLASNNWAGSMYLNSDAAYYTAVNYFWNGAATNSVVKLKNDWFVNGNNNTYVMYSWHSVAGYSKIGSYTSTGSAGLAITGLGFAPSFVMIKNISDTGSWIIHSKPPTTTNPSVYHLRANSSAAQDSGANEQINFDSDGFTLNGTGQNINHSHGDAYLYMAFK